MSINQQQDQKLFQKRHPVHSKAPFTSPELCFYQVCGWGNQVFFLVNPLVEQKKKKRRLMYGLPKKIVS